MHYVSAVLQAWLEICNGTCSRERLKQKTDTVYIIDPYFYMQLNAYFESALVGVLPFKVNIVARKNILNHNYSFCIYLRTNQLWEVQLGTKKIPYWPEPFLSKEWKKVIIRGVSLKRWQYF